MNNPAVVLLLLTRQFLPLLGGEREGRFRGEYDSRFSQLWSHSGC